MSSAGLKQFKMLRGSYEDKNKDRFEPGDTIETKIDLNEKFDPAKEMFERQPDFVPITNVNEDGLDNLTVEGLKKMAEEEEIDLGEATLKADILQTIRESLITQ